MSKPGIDDCCTSVVFDTIRKASKERKERNVNDIEARHVETMRMLDRIANALEEGNRQTMKTMESLP